MQTPSSRSDSSALVCVCRARRGVQVPGEGRGMSMEPRTGTPTDCAEPVEEPGSARWWPWSCATQHLPGHADELRDLGRTREGPLAHDADPRTVDLLVVGAGLDPRCLERREDVAHVPVGDPRRTLGRHDPRGVLRLSGEALL